MIDSCALCLETKEIQLSHFLPKAMYKALRKLSSESKLIIVDSDNDAYLSDNQVVRYLLCKDCEGIFSRKGEDYVARYWRSSNGFALKKKLLSVNPDAKFSDANAYYPNAVPDIESEKFFYFAVSVIWRATFKGWKGLRDEPVALGEKYQKLFRDYLYKQTPLEGVFVYMSVDSEDKTKDITYFPAKTRQAGRVAYAFYLLGLNFYVVVGGYGRNRADDELYRTPNGQPQIVYVLENRDKSAMVAKQISFTAKATPRGNLLD